MPRQLRQTIYAMNYSEPRVIVFVIDSISRISHFGEYQLAVRKSGVLRDDLRRAGSACI